MRKYRVTAEQPAGGSPDLAWLLADDSIRKHLFGAGDRLPIGAEVFAGREQNDVLLWFEDHRAGPVEVVLTAHSGPTDRAALERALS